MGFLHGTTNHGGRHASQSQRRPRALASSCQLASMALVSAEGIASQAARHGDSTTGNSSLAAAGPASSSLTKRQQAKLTTDEGKPFRLAHGIGLGARQGAADSEQAAR